MTSVWSLGVVVWGGGVFFFQAEDGIRDYKVTGVQTCALPIWAAREAAAAHSSRPCLHASQLAALSRRGSALAAGVHAATRSEERRVGKEGRSRGSPDH